MSFLQIDMPQVVNFFLKYDKNVHILHSQYQGRWCPGDARSQGINNHDIYYVEANYFGPGALRI